MKPSRRPEVRSARNRTLNGTTLAINMGDLSGLFNGLRDRLEAVARPVAQAGAEVLYQAVLSNVARNTKSGNLSRAIYQAFSADNSGPGKATYHISWRTGRGTYGDGTGKTALPTAPHGHLIEFGHIQRYASYVGKDGNWYTAVRPEKRGTPKPKSRAPQSEKDAYYVLREGGPLQVAAQPFIRPAKYRAGAAILAAKAKFTELMNQK